AGVLPASLAEDRPPRAAQGGPGDARRGGDPRVPPGPHLDRRRSRPGDPEASGSPRRRRGLRGPPRDRPRMGTVRGVAQVDDAPDRARPATPVSRTFELSPKPPFPRWPEGSRGERGVDAPPCRRWRGVGGWREVTD